jgi:hypothetical protein
MLKVKVKRPKLDDRPLYHEQVIFAVGKKRLVWVPKENSGEALAEYIKQLEEKNRKYWERKNANA